MKTVLNESKKILFINCKLIRKRINMDYKIQEITEINRELVNNFFIENW